MKSESDKLPIPYKVWNGKQCIDQKACDALLDGTETFKSGNPHPSIKGLVYKLLDKKTNSTVWQTQETYELVLEKTVSAARKRRAANPEKVREYGRNRRAANLEKFQEKAREYYLKNTERCKKNSREWRKANVERDKERKRKYNKNNQDKCNAQYARYHARKFGADLDEFGVDQYTEHDKKLTEQLYAHAKRLTECLGIAFHVDHVLPLSCNGSNKPANLQVCTASWNTSKCNRSTDVWGAWEGVADYSIFNK